MKAVLVVAGIMMVAATSACAEEWPLRLEEIWETPGKDEPVFAEGFPPPEIKVVLADTSIPQEDKEWLLNQIRHWAAYRTKKLWLDDGTTMDIPAVKPGDRTHTFTVYASRNMKYWLVRAMRIEGPEMPEKPQPGEPRRVWQVWIDAYNQQLGHWREAFMDVEGRIYWEKEFGPFDIHTEGEWYGAVGAYISDDGEVVVKRGGGKNWFCGKDGACIERSEIAWGEDAALSADGFTFVVHRGTSRSHDVDRGGMCGLSAYDRQGELKWTSEVVPGGTGGSGGVVDVSPDGSRAAFIAVATGGQGEDWWSRSTTYIVDAEGKLLASEEVVGTTRGRVFVSPDGSRVVAAYPSVHLVQSHDARNGGKLWEYRCGAAIGAVSASEDAGVVALSVPGEGVVVLLSAGGTPLSRVHRTKAEVFLSPNGALLVEKAGWLKLSRLVVMD